MNIVRLNKLLVLWAFSHHVTVVQQKNFTISEKKTEGQNCSIKRKKNEAINPQLDKCYLQNITQYLQDRNKIWFNIRYQIRQILNYHVNLQIKLFEVRSYP